MKAAAYEGCVKNGTIHLLEPAALPDNTRVIVVVPQLSGETHDQESDSISHVRTPFLANPADAALFRTVILEASAS